MVRSDAREGSRNGSRGISITKPSDASKYPMRHAEHFFDNPTPFPSWLLPAPPSCRILLPTHQTLEGSRYSVRQTRLPFSRLNLIRGHPGLAHPAGLKTGHSAARESHRVSDHLCGNFGRVDRYTVKSRGAVDPDSGVGIPLLVARVTASYD